MAECQDVGALIFKNGCREYDCISADFDTPSGLLSPNGFSWSLKKTNYPFGLSKYRSTVSKEGYALLVTQPALAIVFSYGPIQNRYFLLCCISRRLISQQVLASCFDCDGCDSGYLCLAVGHLIGCACLPAFL